MGKILFVNACVRENSRTKEHLSGEIQEVNLEQENLKPLDRKMLEKREYFTAQNDFSDEMFNYAKDFSEAETIVIAAPYWDLAFPAVLKIYLEQIVVAGITFQYKKGIPDGLCRAKKLIYVTTAGGTVYDNFGYDYVKALSQKFFGIEEVEFFKAENLDIRGNDAGKIIQTAKNIIYTKMGE